MILGRGIASACENTLPKGVFLIDASGRKSVRPASIDGLALEGDWAGAFICVHASCVFHNCEIIIHAGNPVVVIDANNKFRDFRIECMGAGQQKLLVGPGNTLARATRL